MFGKHVNVQKEALNCRKKITFEIIMIVISIYIAIGRSCHVTGLFSVKFAKVSHDIINMGEIKNASY